MNKLDRLAARLEFLAVHPPTLSQTGVQVSRPTRRLAGPNSRGQARQTMKAPDVRTPARDKLIEQSRRELIAKFRSQFS